MGIVISVISYVVLNMPQNEGGNEDIPLTHENIQRMLSLAAHLYQPRLGPCKDADGNLYLRHGRALKTIYFKRWISVHEIPGRGKETFRPATEEDIWRMSEESSNDAPKPEIGEEVHGFHCPNVGDQVMVGVGMIGEGSVYDDMVVCIVEQESGQESGLELD